MEQLELKLPGEASALKDLGLWAGALVLLTLVAFWPATTGSFVWRDDAVAANKQLLAPAGLSQAWFGRWQGDGKFDRAVYQPVTDSAYWVEYRLGGHDEHGLPAATSFHIAGLLFHVLGAIALWLALREMLVPGAWLIAAVFAVHPVHSEPVSWISEQGVVLSGMLFLASVYCYLMFVKSREQDLGDRAAGGEGIDPAQTWGLFGGAAILCLAANLSSPTAVILPAVIYGLLWWRKRLTAQDHLLLIPLLLVGLVLWFLNVDLHRSVGDGALVRGSIGEQLTAAGRGFWYLIYRLVLPIGFSEVYPRGESSAVFSGIAIVVLAGAAGLYVLRARVGAGVFLAVAIAAALVCVSLNWFDANRLSAVTDGTSYLAVIPLIALGVAVVSRVRLPGPQPQTVVGISTAVLIGLGALALRRTYAFDSSVTLWRDVIAKDPGSAFAHASLAEQLRLTAIEEAKDDNQDAVKQDLGEAINSADAALKLDPANAAAQRTWANVLVSEGDIARAVAHFEAAKSLDPTNAQVRDEYASALIELGRFKEAIAPLNEALMLDANSATTHRLLGQAYDGLGNMDRAIREQTLALELNPGDLSARQKLAEVLTRKGSYKEAIANYERMMEVDPEQMKRPDLWQAIARIKDKQGAFAMAVQYLQQAVQLAPDDADLKKELDRETAKVAATQPSTRASK